MKQSEQDLAYYMALPYTIALSQHPDGWFVQIVELPGCMSYGDTSTEALEMIEDAKLAWISGSLLAGDPVPEPDPYAHVALVRANQKIVEMVGG